MENGPSIVDCSVVGASYRKSVEKLLTERITDWFNTWFTSDCGVEVEFSDLLFDEMHNCELITNIEIGRDGVYLKENFELRRLLVFDALSIDSLDIEESDKSFIDLLGAEIEQDLISKIANKDDCAFQCVDVSRKSCVKGASVLLRCFVNNACLSVTMNNDALVRFGVVDELIIENSTDSLISAIDIASNMSIAIDCKLNGASLSVEQFVNMSEGDVLITHHELTKPLNIYASKDNCLLKGILGSSKNKKSIQVVS